MNSPEAMARLLVNLRRDGAMPRWSDMWTPRTKHPVRFVWISGKYMIDGRPASRIGHVPGKQYYT